LSFLSVFIDNLPAFLLEKNLNLKFIFCDLLISQLPHKQICT
jgi:hypothetical protein